MLLIKPKLAILDEIDSGLDIDAVKIISNSINNFKNNKRSIIIITHYNRLLEYILPDFVHIFLNGNIVKTGDKSLAKKIEKRGYDLFK